MTTCSSCGANIHWVRMEPSGKPMPLDEVPSPRGNVVRTDLKGGARAWKKDDDPALTRWMSHFATCPHAASFRKRR